MVREFLRIATRSRTTPPVTTMARLSTDRTWLRSVDVAQASGGMTQEYEERTEHSGDRHVWVRHYPIHEHLQCIVDDTKRHLRNLNLGGFAGPFDADFQRICLEGHHDGRC